MTPNHHEETEDLAPIDLRNAPWGGGEPDPVLPADNELQRLVHEALGAASMCWNPRPTGEFDSTAAAAIGAQLVDDIHVLQVQQEHSDRLADAAHDDFVEQLRAQENPLQALVYSLMEEHARPGEIINLPTDLGDDRISPLELWFEGVLRTPEGTKLRFKVEVDVGDAMHPTERLIDDLELDAAIVPLTPEFAAAAVASLRGHLLKRMGMADGEATVVRLDHDGNPIPTL